MSECECVCGKCKPTLADRLLHRGSLLWGRGWPWRKDGDLMSEAFMEIKRLEYALEMTRAETSTSVQSPPTSNLDH